MKYNIGVLGIIPNNNIGASCSRRNAKGDEKISVLFILCEIFFFPETFALLDSAKQPL